MFFKVGDRFRIRGLTILCSLVTPFNLNAAEPPQSNATCIACHGEAGISSNDLWPNIAGQKNGYIIEQLKAFKSGVRVNPLMSPISQTLSDSDIKELALYYSSLVPRVNP